MSEIAGDVANAPLEALEGPPLLLVESPAEDGGLDLLIYDEQGRLVGVSHVPAELVESSVGGWAVAESQRGERPSPLGARSADAYFGVLLADVHSRAAFVQYVHGLVPSLSRNRVRRSGRARVEQEF